MLDVHRDEFAAGAGSLNTSTVGLPPRRALAVLRQHLGETGRCDPTAFDAEVDRARASYAELVGSQSESVGDWLIPRMAGWYSSARPWESIYGPPLRLAQDARRFNQSPPWFDIAAAAEATELLARIGVDTIRGHSVDLASEFRARLGLPLSDSAIVAVETDRAGTLDRAGITASVRAGRVRLSFYLYNTMADVDAAAEALVG